MASAASITIQLNEALVDELNRTREELIKLRIERDTAAKLVRRLLRSHGEKSSYRSVSSRAAAGLWIASYDKSCGKTTESP